ncbi:MAG: Txe/YoeB family addiction module toxin [Cyanothece sp. SIO2G6]|nr:Txe/YoeB family addiction module toxin [Cyanothece sp. SIO2G6]
MRNITFTPDAFDDFTIWAKQDRKIYQKIVSLINDTLRQPFTGLGKPESLKHELSGCWSRCITDEHRLVYKVTDTEIIIVSCRFHYGN